MAVEPTDGPYGRWAVGQDPYGAAFALLVPVLSPRSGTISCTSVRNGPSMVMPVRGDAAVAAGNAETAAAAVSALRSGGNAFDAAVAAGFAAAVTEPALTSLGGGGFLLGAPTGADPVVFDFFVDAPGRGLPDRVGPPDFVPVTVRFAGTDQVFHAGWGSVAVPGCLDGYLHVHRRLGALPLGDVVAPAISLARDGDVVDAAQARLLAMLHEIFTLSDEGRRVFAPHGRPIAAGERMRNEPLAAFLADVGAGRVHGIADAAPRELAATMQRSRGLVTRADVSSYRVAERQPLHIDYRGADVLLNPPPSFGGSVVAGGLRELALGPVLDHSPPAARRLADVLIGMSQRHASGPVAVRGTTHVSVLDREGNVASMTTSNGTGSGQFIPGTGVQLNNMLGESDLNPGGFHGIAAGQRIGSMMTPMLVSAQDGRRFGLGSGGSERIRSALTTVLVNLLDRGMPIAAAVHAPRMHWDGAVLQMEPGLGPDVVRELMHHRPVNEWSHRDVYFGGAHVVALRPGGTAEAAADDRRGGCAVVLRGED